MIQHRSLVRGAFAFFLLFAYSAYPVNAQGKQAASSRQRIASSPQRIVSLSPAMTEVLFAIGAGGFVVARTTECDYPPEALALPAIGGFDGKTISAERIIALSPTLVCGAAGMHDWLSAALSPLGIALYLSRAESLAAVMDEVMEMGRLTHCGEGAHNAVRRMQETLRKAPVHSAPVSVYWEVWSAPLMAAGGHSFMNDIIRLAGGKNIFASLSAAYPIVSGETILAMNPAVIVVSRDAFTDKAAAEASLRGRAGWGALDAVEHGRIIIMDDAAVRPCPRAADAVLSLSASLAQCFANATPPHAMPQ